MIEICGLTKRYEKTTVLENMDLTVSDSSVFGLVGINGAGKSTLLRLIAGVLKPDAGTILVDGEAVYENEAVKRKVFFLPTILIIRRISAAKDLRIYTRLFTISTGKFTRNISISLS